MMMKVENESFFLSDYLFPIYVSFALTRLMKVVKERNKMLFFVGYSLSLLRSFNFIENFIHWY